LPYTYKRIRLLRKERRERGVRGGAEEEDEEEKKEKISLKVSTKFQINPFTND
jgi:hypothetical protein